MNQIIMLPAMVTTVAMITFRRRERAGGTLLSTCTGTVVVLAAAAGQWPLMVTGVPRSIQS